VLRYIGREPTKTIGEAEEEGHIKESIYFNGEFRDEAIYSRLR